MTGVEYLCKWTDTKGTSLGWWCYFLSSTCDLKISWVNCAEILELSKCENTSKNTYQLISVWSKALMVSQRNLGTVSRTSFAIKAYFRKAWHVCGMINKGNILISLGQFEDETSLNTMRIWSFWSKKKLKEIQKWHCMWVQHALSVWNKPWLCFPF